MANTKRRARTERRAQTRIDEKLLSQRKRLAELDPGGSPARPMVVESVSQIDVRSNSITCLRCHVPLRADEPHRVAEFSGQRLRIAELRCPMCGEKRNIYFQLQSTIIN